MLRPVVADTQVLVIIWSVTHTIPGSVEDSWGAFHSFQREFKLDAHLLMKS